MGERIFRAVDTSEWGLYIEGQRCPFTMLQISYGDGQIPMLSGSIPAVESIGSNGISYSVRNLPPNSKIVAIHKNAILNQAFPSFEVRFIGELTSPGFTRNASDKGYSFRAQHFTYNLRGVSMTALEPGAYLESVITGQPEEGSNLELTISGTVFEKFSPKAIAEISSIAEDKLTIHDFVKHSLGLYIAKAIKSPTSLAHPVQAAVHYGMFEHLYTSTEKDTKMDWKKLYQLIMHYTYMDLVPKISGTRLSYLEMIQTMCQLFLQTVDIDPSPRKYQQTILTKPDMAFLPPPKCNVILPIYTTNYTYHEEWERKATRLIQIQQPASGIDAAILRKYMRTVSPPALRDKFQAYANASTESDRNKLDLTTEEEKVRGIVESYNDIPAFISASFQVLTEDKDATKNGKRSTGTSLVGAAVPQQIVDNGTQIDYYADMPIKESDRERIFKKAFLHEKLLRLETGLDVIDDNTFNAGGGMAISGTNKCVPMRIYVIDTTSAYGCPANYIIDANGKVTLKLGRYFHLFHEPKGLPIAIKLAKTKDTILDKKKERKAPFNDPCIIFPGDAGPSSVTALTEGINADPNETPSYETLAKGVSGGTHYALVIRAPLTDLVGSSALDNLTQLLCILCTFCGISMNQGIITLFDEYDTFFRNKTGTGVDALGSATVKTTIGDAISKASLTLLAEMDKAYADYLTQIGAATTGANQADSKVTAGGNTGKPVATNYPLVQTYRVVVAKDPLAVPESTTPDTKTEQGTKTEPAYTPITSLAALRTTLQYEEIADLAAYLAACNAITASLPLWDGFVGFFNTPESGLLDKAGKKPYETLKLKARTVSKAILDEKNNAGAFNDKLEESPALGTLIMLMGLALGIGGQASTAIKGIVSIVKNHITDTPETLASTILTQYITDGTLVVQAFIQTYPTQFSSEDDLNKDTVFSALETITGFKGDRAFIATKQPTTSRTKEETTEDSIEDKKIRFQALQTQYIEPICDYYFYKNRHAPSVSDIQMPYHPFITPGFSALVVDASPMQMHQYAYVHTVTHVITPESAWTTVGLSHVRRADEERWQEMAMTATPYPNTDIFPLSPAEWVAQHSPFFSGEYSTTVDEKGELRLNKTYQKLLGCPMAVADDITKEVTEMPDYTEAVKFNKRIIQHAQIGNVPTTTGAQAVYKKYYDNAESKVYFNWNNGDLPLNINLTKGKLTEAHLLAGTQPPPTEKIGKFLWDAGTQAIIKKMWYLSKSRSAQRG